MSPEKRRGVQRRLHAFLFVDLNPGSGLLKAEVADGI
jgi:hypothetical protein